MSSVAEIDYKENMAKGVTYVAAAVTMPEIEQLRNRIISMEAILNSLIVQIANIQAQLAKKETISVEEILPPPSDEVKEAVASYLREKGEAYPSEIADKLGISIKEVLAALSVFQKEKKVAEV
jgi:hypothetical protein